MLVALQVLGSSLIAQSYTERPLRLTVLTVNADAIVRVAPNQVVLSLGVVTRSQSLMDAKTENYKIIEKAISLCKSEGIEGKHIQTDFVSIRPIYHKDHVMIEFYQVEQTLNIVLGELSKYDKLITELMNNGINLIHSVEFRSTEMHKYRDEARRMAIQAAKEKALLLSSETEIQLDRIINVSEVMRDYDNYRSPTSNISQNIIQYGDVSQHSETLSAGMIPIKASITLTYSLKEDE